MRRHQALIILDVAPAYERAEPNAAIADGNIAEPGQTPQIDQQARGRQAEGENRHQTLSPGDDERLGVRREQVDCFAKSAGGLIIEGRRFHCYASRGKTLPGAICARRRSRERESATPTTVARASRTRNRAIVGVKTANARAYRSRTPCGPRGCAQRRTGPDRAVGGALRTQRARRRFAGSTATASSTARASPSRYCRPPASSTSSSTADMVRASRPASGRGRALRRQVMQARHELNRDLQGKGRDPDLGRHTAPATPVPSR